MCTPDRFELAYELGDFVVDKLQKLYEELIDHCATIDPDSKYRNQLRDMKEYFEKNK